VEQTPIRQEVSETVQRESASTPPDCRRTEVMDNNGGRNFPRYTSYASGGGGGNGGGNNGGSGGGGGNGARRKQRTGRYSHNNGINGHRNYGGGDGARFSPPRNPQKFKSYSDKRPRTRNAGGGEMGETEIAPGTREAFGYSLDVADSHESFGANRGRAGKKTNYNVNHLLNFTYDEPRRGRHHESGRPMGRGRKISTSSTGHVAFNKDHYLLATCQFVLHSNVDQKPYLDNPDLLVDWSTVEQVRIRSVGDVLCCPICLEVPVAPQVTKCGHVYCYACLLHHAASAEKKWSSCPICFEMVYVEDLRSATLLPTPITSVGDVLNMTLITVEANPGEGGNGLPHPVESTEEIAALSSSSSLVFEKILSLSDAEIQSRVLEPEISEILAAKISADVVEVMFLDQALEAVKIRKEKLQQGEWERSKTGDFLQAVEGVDDDGVADIPLGGDADSCIDADWFDFEEDSVAEATEEAKKSIHCLEEVEEKTTDEGNSAAPAEEAEKSEVAEDCVHGAAVEGPEVVTAEDPPKSAKSAASLLPTGDYFFYQSADGQKIFLHSLNAKCLAFEYGALNAAPSAISGRILQIDEGIVTEGLRKRCRYLSTLPIHCPFKVVELDLKSPLVSEQALENFASELQYRKQQRQSKERYEKRFHRKQQKKEKRQNSTTVIVPSASSQSSDQRRPGSESTTPISSVPETVESVSGDPSSTMFPEFNITVVKQGVTPQHPDAAPAEEDDQVASFAQMLRSGKSKPQTAVKAWPGLGGAKNPISDEKPCPWGKKPVVAKEVGKEALSKDDKEAMVEEGEEFFVPAFKESFSDALAKAFDNLDVEDAAAVSVKAEEKEAGVAADIDGSAKKKKKKPKLLFSTSMQSRMK